MAQHSVRPLRLAALTAAFALVVSACGGEPADNGADSDSASSSDGSSPTAEATATPTDGAPSTLATAWTGELVGAVAVTDGFVGVQQIGDEDEDAMDGGAYEIVMLSAEDGSELWRHPVEAEGELPRVTVTASPDGSTAYLGTVTSAESITTQSPEPVLTAYDVASGEEQWSTPVEGGVDELNTDGVDASAGLILAWQAVVSPEDGSIVREPSGLGDGSYTPLSEDRILVGDFGSEAQVETAEGEVAWQLGEVDRPAACEPAGASASDASLVGGFAGIVVMSCFDASGHEEHLGFLDGESGALLAELPTAGSVGSEQITEAVHDAEADMTILSGPVGTLGIDLSAGELAWHDASLDSTRFRPGPAYDGLVYGAGAVLDEQDGSVAEEGEWRPPLGITSDGVFLFSADESTAEVIAMRAE
ncbi:PQQ-binding-like beta-propeller repeat protein [Nocardioides sp. BGMRC 2183]|nr:PQQ-binding-like beta-propeller repeat protein [Nocardioides sp. BGMRC 2183]